MKFFTSDTHFGHRAVIRYSNRPFATVEEMNEAMIHNWNADVKPADEIYHIGDFSFLRPEETEKILARLNGRKHLIFGNHDKALLKSKHLQSYFESCSKIMDLVVRDDSLPLGKQHIVLCHFPMLTWNKGHHGSWMLHGHSHGAIKYPNPNARIMDVGVDPQGFKPISYEEIRAIMVAREDIEHH